MMKFLSLAVRKRGSGRSGFTLIELLIVIAILGMLAAMLIPSMLEALHKGRQKRTMTGMRDFGLGLGAYWSDVGGAAAAGQAAGSSVAISDWQGTASINDLKNALVPEYLPYIPVEDGWGYPLEYRIVIDNPPRSRYALIRAPSLKGAYEGDSYNAGVFDPSDYEQDIVWADGGFLRAPDPS